MPIQVHQTLASICSDIGVKGRGLAALRGIPGAPPVDSHQVQDDASQRAALPAHCSSLNDAARDPAKAAGSLRKPCVRLCTGRQAFRDHADYLFGTRDLLRDMQDGGLHPV